MAKIIDVIIEWREKENTTKLYWDLKCHMKRSIQGYCYQFKRDLSHLLGVKIESYPLRRRSSFVLVTNWTTKQLHMRMKSHYSTIKPLASMGNHLHYTNDAFYDELREKHATISRFLPSSLIS
ncbi:CLUMA_CG005784, isoform A [Clunio marinus]|uniref:CLUMA_CG005784, isoform A n=1 Tax=Clunio marinus TaxID=568069 RepID=A0A1J1HVR0_9DIPT|nr:CLUMA_CG005784, isoform A [Clunio marinus]